MVEQGDPRVSSYISLILTPPSLISRDIMASGGEHLLISAVLWKYLSTSLRHSWSEKNEKIGSKNFWSTTKYCYGEIGLVNHEGNTFSMRSVCSSGDPIWHYLNQMCSNISNILSHFVICFIQWKMKYKNICLFLVHFFFRTSSALSFSFYWIPNW